MLSSVNSSHLPRAMVAPTNPCTSSKFLQIRTQARIQFDHKTSDHTVYTMGIVKALDIVSVGKDVLIVISALQEMPSNSPYRSLHDRVLERIVQLHADFPDSQKFHIITALSPLSGPNALTLSSVILSWLLPFEEHLSMDVVSMAYSLWTPANPASRYHLYEDCFKTSTRLVNISSKTIPLSVGF
jgi:hypothetical protein